MNYKPFNREAVGKTKQSLLGIAAEYPYPAFKKRIVKGGHDATEDMPWVLYVAERKGEKKEG